MNTFILSGNVGTEPEKKEYNGTQMLKFSVAEHGKSKGEEVTTWYACYVPATDRPPSKGDKVQVVGKLLTPGAYTDKSGVPKAQMAVWCYDCQVLYAPKAKAVQEDLPF